MNAAAPADNNAAATTIDSPAPAPGRPRANRSAIGTMPIASVTAISDATIVADVSATENPSVNGKIAGASAATTAAQTTATSLLRTRERATRFASNGPAAGLARHSSCVARCGEPAASDRAVVVLCGQPADAPPLAPGAAAGRPPTARPSAWSSAARARDAQPDPADG